VYVCVMLMLEDWLWHGALDVGHGERIKVFVGFKLRELALGWCNYK